MNNNHRIWILNYQSRFRLREIVVLWGVLELRGPFSWGPGWSARPSAGVQRQTTGGGEALI